MVVIITIMKIIFIIWIWIVGCNTVANFGRIMKNAAREQWPPLPLPWMLFQQTATTSLRVVMHATCLMPAESICVRWWHWAGNDRNVVNAEAGGRRGEAVVERGLPSYCEKQETHRSRKAVFNRTLWGLSLGDVWFPLAAFVRKSQKFHFLLWKVTLVDSAKPVAALNKEGRGGQNEKLWLNGRNFWEFYV